ncbi:MAG: DUF3750 domain-containing protein [Planctomycetes bacterium]|nr:DUF3750 domain-containing protein [Planctomycetota bacterium]
MSRPLISALLCVALLGAGCSTAFDPAQIPRDQDYLVLVKSARLPGKFGPLVAQAHHAWFELKDGSDARWESLEVLASSPVQLTNVLRSDPLDFELDVLATERWEHPVHLLQVLSGADAKRAIGILRAEAADYEAPDLYVAWPGPNSNTFVERLLRRCPGLDAALHHNSIGKDWAWLRVGPSATGSGVELETPLLGVQLGLEEGVELHVLQLTFGIDLWPPALELPFLPRLGFPQGGSW